MNQNRIVVFGAGGHGKVVADILLAGGFTVVGFIDDGKPCGATVLGLPVLGNGDWFFSKMADTDFSLALGIGNSDTRDLLVRKCRTKGIPVITAIHPTAAVSVSARISSGAVVMANACINPDACVGSGAIVNTGAVVEHDCVVGDFAHIGPNATMTGAGKLGAYSTLWTGSVVLPGISIGTRSIVGAGAVVREDIPDGVIAVGVPARVLTRAITAAQ